MKNIIKNFAIFFLVFAVIGGIFSLYNNSFKSVETISISQLVQEINQDKVEKINVTGDKLNIILKDKSEKQSTKEAGESLSNLLKNYGVEANKLNALNIEVGKDPNSGIMFSSILPFLIPALFILGLIWFMMRQVSGVNNRAMSFGQSGAKMADQEKIKVTFKDVAGAIEAKNDLEKRKVPIWDAFHV